jgi:hypothetical protein
LVVNERDRGGEPHRPDPAPAVLHGVTDAKDVGWPISGSRGGGEGTNVPTPGDMEEIGQPAALARSPVRREQDA